MARQCCGAGGINLDFSCASLADCSIGAHLDVTIPDIAPGDTLIWTGSTFVPSGNTGDSVCFHINGGVGIEVSGKGSAMDPIIITNTGSGTEGGGVAQARWDGLQPQPINGIPIAHDENGVLLLPMWVSPTVVFGDTAPTYDGVVQGDRWANMAAGQVYVWSADSNEWVAGETFTTSGVNKIEYSWDVEGVAGTQNQFNVRRALDTITVTGMKFYHPTEDPSGGTQASSGSATIEFVVDGVVAETINWNLATDFYSHTPSLTTIAQGSEMFFRITNVASIPVGERWVWPSMVLTGTI